MMNDRLTIITYNFAIILTRSKLFMAEQGLIIKNIINKDPLGDIYQAIYKSSPVIIKKYNKEISKVISKNYLEFKTYFHSSKNLSDDILLRMIDIIIENEQVIIIYENEDNLKFLSQVFSSGEIHSQNFDFDSKNDNNFWIELIYPLILFLKKSHELGHFHGLLNPYNVGFTEDYRLKVLGFGFEYKILTWISNNQFNSISNSSSFFIPYLNYKVLANNYFDYESDIFAVGVLIYKLYSGHQPYDDINVKEASELSINLKSIDSISSKKFKPLKQIIDHNSKDISEGLYLIDKYIYSVKDKSSNRSYLITLGAVFIIGALVYSYKNSSYVIKEKYYNRIASKSIKTPKNTKQESKIVATNSDADITIKKLAVKDKSEIIAKKNKPENKITVKKIDKKYTVIAKVDNKPELKPEPKPIINKVVKRYYKIGNDSKSSQVCSSKIINGVAKKVCNDVLKNQIRGPEYYTVNLDNSSQKLAVTTPIRVIDYKKYCYFTKKCDYFSSDANYEKSKLLGKDFAEVMNSIKKYNIYCLLTDNCAGLNNNKIKQPMIGLSQSEITDYIDWLNMVSGSKYELLENKVALSKVENDLKKGCNLTNKKSNSLCNVILNNYQNNSQDETSKKLQTAYVLVRK